MNVPTHELEQRQKEVSLIQLQLSNILKSCIPDSNKEKSNSQRIRYQKKNYKPAIIKVYLNSKQSKKWNRIKFHKNLPYQF